MKVWKNKTFCDIAFILALAFKIASQGFSYYPVLDDYIQYGGYPLYENLSHVYLNIGTIATRPFASLIDPVVWGAFFPDMFMALAIISALFFLGTKLIAKTLERLRIHITPFLYAVVLLCPLGFEGTYWISAASRICVGLFFTGLTLFLLAKAIDRKNKIWFVLYVFSAILSFGFYESIMIVSAILQFAVITILIKNKKKCFGFLMFPILCGILMFVYYKFAGSIGVLGSRANGFSFSGFGYKLRELFTQFFEIMIKGGINTIFKGAISGIKLMISSYYGLIALILAVLISGVCAYFGARLDFIAPAKYCIPLGLALIFLPLLPNALTDTVWLTYRSVVPCFIGLSMISAPLFCKILNKKKLRIAVIFFMVILFSVANYNELDTYRRVNEKDTVMVTKICQKLDADVTSGKKEAIVVLNNEVAVPQVSYYKDHVKSVFDSDWALTGAVRANLKNTNIKMITPVLSLDGVSTHGKQVIYIGGNYE